MLPQQLPTEPNPAMYNQAALLIHETDPFELKTCAVPIPVLKLYESDIDHIAERLGQTTGETPGLFHHAPIVIDLTSLEASDEAVDFPLLVRVMRDSGMQPIGVQGGSGAQQQSAESTGLVVLGKNSAGERKRWDKAEKAQAKSAINRETKFVNQPVRSGQRIYAPGADLVITAQVSSGAEVIADGNIHVYGALRGRAMAGIKGDTRSRIFCLDFSAELVSIAGHYKVTEDVFRLHRGKPVQIYLQIDRLNSLIVAPISMNSIKGVRLD